MDDLHPDEASQLAACLERLASGDLAARDEIIELCGGRLRVLASRMLSRFPTVRRWDDTDVGNIFAHASTRRGAVLNWLENWRTKNYNRRK